MHSWGPGHAGDAWPGTGAGMCWGTPPCPKSGCLQGVKDAEIQPGPVPFLAGSRQTPRHCDEGAGMVRVLRASLVWP